MKTFFCAILLAMLVGCGGGDPVAQPEKEHALLIANSPTNQRLSNEFGVLFYESTGSDYYREGSDVVLRIDNNNPADWVDYQLVSASLTTIEVQVRTPSGIPGVYDVALMEFFMNYTGAFTAIVDIHSTDAVGKFTIEANTLASRMGMNLPSIGWFNGSTKIDDLIRNPL
jgi:hypothetical protein